jgi:hypothetical protein
MILLLINLERDYHYWIFFSFSLKFLTLETSMLIIKKYQEVCGEKYSSLCGELRVKRAILIIDKYLGSGKLNFQIFI